MGCVYAQKDVFDCPWIAPEITKNAIGAKRLAKYLSVKGKLILIKRDSNKDRKLTTVKSKNKDRKISFYLGQNKRKNGLTKENCGGLAIEIINETTNGRVESLFCGDVPYRAIETTVWNSRKVQLEKLGVNGSPIYATAPITAKRKGNTVSFKWKDTWGNSGTGTLKLYKGYVKLKVKQTYTARWNRSTLDTSGKYMKIYRKSGNTKMDNIDL